MSVEGGNFHEDAIIQENNAAEISEEQVARDELPERANVSNETLLGVESEQNDVEIQEQVVTTLARFEGLAEQQGLEGFDVFQTYILTATLEDQNLFIDRSNIRTLFEIVSDLRRFPVNSFEFRQSFIEGTSLEEVSQHRQEAIETDAEAIETDAEAIETDAEAIETDAEAIETIESLRETLGRTNIRVQSIRELSLVSSSFDIPQELRILLNQEVDLPSLPELPLTQEKISSFQTSLNAADNSIQRVTDYLRSNRDIENEILPQAQAQGPEVYGRVVSGLVSLDSGFQARIDAWEMTPDFTEIPAEQRVRVSGALGTSVEKVATEVEQSGNIFTIDGVDGTEVEYDVVTNERSISLDGYTIQTEADDPGDYQTPKLAYMRTEQVELPKLQVIQTLSEAFNAKGVDTDDLAEIKATIASIPGTDVLGIDFASMKSGEAIRQALSSAFSESSQSLEDARREYRDELLALRDSYAGILASRDKRVRSTLGLLRDTGITQMPQSVFTQVSEAINISPEAYGFQTTINLEAGELGFDTLGDNENNDRVQFAQMVNIMLGVEPESEFAIDAESVNGIGNTAISDRAAFNTYVAEQSGWHEVGAANTILERLRRRDG